MPLGPRRAGRGDVAPRPGRPPHRDDPELRRLRGRRRVQRRPRAQALLRNARGDRDLAGRQPRRPPDRGPDLPGRRGAGASRLASVRRRRARGPQRAQLHRTGLRRRGPRSAAPTGAHSAASKLRPGRRRLGADLRQEGARWFHCGGVFGALSRNGGAGARGDAGRAPARGRSSPSTSTTAPRCGRPRAARTRGRGQRPPRRDGRRAARERGGPLGRARLLARRRRRRPPPARPTGLRGAAAAA